MSVKERKRVLEHRVTIQIGIYSVRFWIEGDVRHDGIKNWDIAQSICARAVELIPLTSRTTMSHSRLAEHLLEAVAYANSVEVCDRNGNGTAIHRNWP